MLTELIAVHYCYTYLIDQIPVGLLLYSHIPTALAALLFGAYIFGKLRDIRTLMLLLVCVCFAVWCALDLTSWFAFLGSSTLMFAWSIQDVVALLMFFFAFYFLYAFLSGNDLPAIFKDTSLVLIAPTAVAAILGLNLTLYDANSCVAIEDQMVTLYPYLVEVIFILSAIALTFYYWKKPAALKDRYETFLAGVGVTLFMLFFFSATFLVGILAPDDASSYVYNYEIYGLFGMPLFVAYFGYIIVRYKTFDPKVFGAQALVAALAVIVASEFTFVTSTANRILVGVTFVLILIAGYVLVRSVRHEIEQREEIERLSEEKSEFMTFASHEIRNPVTAMRGYASLLADGTMGALPPQAIEAVQRILIAGNDVLHLISEYLMKSKLELGKIELGSAVFDVGNAITLIVDGYIPHARHRGLQFNKDIDPNEHIMIQADEMRVKEIVGNLIDNSLKYTPHGSITVSVHRFGTNARIVVADTGVGIAPETLPHLFGKFTRADAQKVNLLGTGVGLFLAKDLTVKMGGRIWAESEGKDKGSRFIMEFPLANT